MLFRSDSMGDFPTGYMITGAIFGHAQALVAPLLYGWVYRSWMMQRNSNAGKSVAMKNKALLKYLLQATEQKM